MVFNANHPTACSHRDRPYSGTRRAGICEQILWYQLDETIDPVPDNIAFATVELVLFVNIPKFFVLLRGLLRAASVRLIVRTIRSKPRFVKRIVHQCMCAQQQIFDFPKVT